MRVNSLRVVIDTNIWISFLIGKALSGLEEKIIDNKIRILFSDELLSELVEVLHRRKFRQYFSLDNIVELIELIYSIAEWVSVEEHFDACRDPKDNFLLDLCVSGNADYLVTGDQALLDLDHFHNTRIIHYKFFSDIVQE